MSNNATTIAAMVLYMGICLVLGFVAWRRTRSLGDFILGGRSLGSWVTALSARHFCGQKRAACRAVWPSARCHP